MSRPSRIVMTISLLAGVAAFAPSAQADRCRKVRAEINLSEGTIEGNFGLDGTVVFVGDSDGEPPPTAPPGSSVFSGILTITTDRGVLEMRETGMFSSRTGNPNGPVLSSWGEALGGTGRYDGVTGDVTFFGRITGGAFLVDMTGELCEL